MNKSYVFLFVLLALLASGFSSGTGNNPRHDKASPAVNKPTASFTVVFYNTENFYDTLNDPLINDDEFTPQGKVPWTSERFLKKEKNLAQVFKAIVAPVMPDIIGMAEVENRSVLEQLIAMPDMAGTSYGIVHYDSPDERGIDVAMFYNTKTFTVLHSEPLKVSLSVGTDRTRDILYVKGKTFSGTVLHIFINHWPSRREGTNESEVKRMEAAVVLRQQTDKIMLADKKANILIMGDFNDNPDNLSITSGIGALSPEAPIRPDKFYNLLSPKYKEGSGSLYYKSWDLFDQIIVSGNLMSKSRKSLDCSPADAGIFKAEWLLYTNNKGEALPNRTMGSKYFGGYSDHLPVYVTLR